jgi:undecaprenyl-diphosphatase
VLADVTPLVSATPFESFPSAHAALTMALAVSVMPFRRHLGHMLIAFAILVGLSRLYVGVHYPLDVVVGFLFGIVISLAIHNVFKK